MADIAISREGISTSWRRFLADAGTGYIVYLLLYIAFIKNGTVFTVNIRALLPGNTEWPSLAMIGALLFLLAPAVGVVVDNIGHVSLHWFQKLFENRWYKCDCGFAKHLKDKFLLEECKTVFGFGNDTKNRDFRLRKLVAVFNAYHPPVTLILDANAGPGVFFRNLAVLSLAVGAVLGHWDGVLLSYLAITIGPLVILYLIPWPVFQWKAIRAGSVALFIILMFVLTFYGWHLSWSRALILPFVVGGGGFFGFILLSSRSFFQQQLMTFAEGWAWYLREDQREDPGEPTDDGQVQNLL